jgi:hypothetical protein
MSIEYVELTITDAEPINIAISDIPEAGSGGGLSPIAANTLLGNNTGSTALPTGLTAEQARTLLSVYSTSQVDTALDQRVLSTDARLGVIYDSAFDNVALRCSDEAWTFGTTLQRDNLRTALQAAAASHTHDASAINAGTLDIARIPTGTSSSTVCIGNDGRLSDATTAKTRTDTGSITIRIDGGGATITTGAKSLRLRVPYACTITGWELVADQSGSAVVDIWKDTYANYPPTNADSITGSAKPTLSTQDKAQSSTLTGWVTSLAAGDYIEIEVESATSVQVLTLTLTVAR